MTLMHLMRQKQTTPPALHFAAPFYFTGRHQEKNNYETSNGGAFPSAHPLTPIHNPMYGDTSWR
ncbi:hypothetical protein ACFOGG_12970 [Brenneria rubrifaciens]|uniref:hypothetical protein n=1 Tax=Brenneria rubrifaciens TaxID=55213 RepID=UPI0026A5B858